MNAVKMALLFFCLMANFSVVASNEYTDPKTDRRNNALHVGGSLVLGALGQAYLDNVLVSFTACMAIGGAKELADHASDDPDRQADINDMYWNALGCALGVAGVKGIQVYRSSDAVLFGYRYAF